MAFIRGSPNLDFEEFKKNFINIRSNSTSGTHSSFSSISKSNKSFGESNILSQMKLRIIGDETSKSEDISDTEQTSPICFDIMLGLEKDIRQFISDRQKGFENLINFYYACSKIIKKLAPHTMGGGRLVAEFPTNINSSNLSYFLDNIRKTLKDVSCDSFRIGQNDEYKVFSDLFSDSNKKNESEFSRELDLLANCENSSWLISNDSHVSFFSPISERSSNSHISVSLIKHGINQFNLLIIIDSYWKPAVDKCVANIKKMMSDIVMMINFSGDMSKIDKNSIKLLNESLCLDFYTKIRDFGHPVSNEIDLSMKDAFFEKKYHANSNIESNFNISDKKSNLHIIDESVFFKIAGPQYCKAMSVFHRRCTLTNIINSLSKLFYVDKEAKSEKTLNLFSHNIQALKRSFVQMPSLSKKSLDHVYHSNKSSNYNAFDTSKNNIFCKPVMFNLISDNYYIDYSHSGWEINNLTSGLSFIRIYSNMIHVDNFCFRGFPISVGEVGTGYMRIPVNPRYGDTDETMLQSIQRNGPKNIKESTNNKYADVSDIFNSNKKIISINDDISISKSKNDLIATDSINESSSLLEGVFGIDVSDERSQKIFDSGKSSTNNLISKKMIKISIDRYKVSDLFPYFSGEINERVNHIFPTLDNYLPIYILSPPIITKCLKDAYDNTFSFNKSNSRGSTSSSSRDSSEIIESLNYLFNRSSGFIFNLANYESHKNINGDLMEGKFFNFKEYDVDFIFKNFDGSSNNIGGSNIIIPYQKYMSISKTNTYSCSINHLKIDASLRQWLENIKIIQYMKFIDSKKLSAGERYKIYSDLVSKKKKLTKYSSSSNLLNFTTSVSFDLIGSQISVVSFKDVDSFNIKDLPINPLSEYLVLSQSHIGNIISMGKSINLDNKLTEKTYKKYSKVDDGSINFGSEIYESPSSFSSRSFLDQLSNDNISQDKEEKTIKLGSTYYVKKTKYILNILNK